MQTFKDYHLLKNCVDGLELEIAISIEDQQKGLMDRESLPENHGMLFVYPKPTRLSFWMKNTEIPLDIAFIDEVGEIKEIHNLVPHDETHVLSNSPCKYALEVNRGWFRNNDYRKGDIILNLY